MSHYWLSLDNRDDTHYIVPDGAVDAVMTIGKKGTRVDIHGTATSRTALPLDVGSHYIGIRFRPGRARHFIDLRASDLTNTSRPAPPSFEAGMLGVSDSITTIEVFEHLDSLLLRCLGRRRPSRCSIDDAILRIESARGSLRMAELAEVYDRGRRQFQRQFLDTVGIPAKRFAGIVRFQRACALIANSSLPLAHIAAELGYADQSHFAHEFSRFYGQPPARTRGDVAFLQDPLSAAAHNDDSPSGIEVSTCGSRASTLWS